jgi:hypothetical protein
MLSYKLMWWREESLAVLRVTVGGRARWLDLVIYSTSDGRVRFILLGWLAVRSGWSIGLGCVTIFQ